MSRWGDQDEFATAIRVWADELHVSPSAIAIRPMTTKWGSCSSGGRVTFDAGLLEHPREFGEYVIVHELLHLRVRNHGPVFWALLGAYLPDWRQRVALVPSRRAA